jgi:hypothetical protein
VRASTLGPRAAGSPPFAFAADGHPLAASLAPLRAAVAADAGLQPSGAGGEVVRADLRAAPDAAGGWALQRLYWSVQRPDPGAPGALRARMLLCERGSDGTACTAVHAFPDDPGLRSARRADGPLVAGHAGAPVTVLRYIPLRRITFRTAGAGPAVIGKIKAPRSLERAEARLGAVRAAAARATFAVAEPLGIDRARGVWFQALCAGRPLAQIAIADRADDLAALHRLGATHREIHGLDVDAPADDEGARRAGLRADLGWVAGAAPAHAADVARLDRWLRANLRRCAERDRRFCHVDFSPSQVLCDGDAWTVLDFDDSHRGDPYADLAATLVSLEYETDAPGPVSDEAAAARAAAYLAGYGAPLDEDRLLGHRVAEALALLAKRLRKDRARADEPAAALAALLALTGA